MNLTQEEIDDMIFVARSMALAQEIAHIDYGRIHRLLKDKDRPTAILCPALPDDRVTPRIQVSLALLAFTSEQLKMVVPELEDVKKGISILKEGVDPEVIKPFDDLMKELRWDIE